MIDEDTDPDMHHTVVVLGNGTLLGLHQHQRPAPLGRFSEFQVGLDHVAFGCGNRDEREKWSRRLDELGIEHGGIKDTPYGSGLAFRLQALILSPNVAPNGLFFISNVELLTLP